MLGNEILGFMQKSFLKERRNYEIVYERSIWS